MRVAPPRPVSTCIAGARASGPRASIDASDATLDLLHGFDFRDAIETMLEQPRPFGA
jgi:hypothetical protein